MKCPKCNCGRWRNVGEVASVGINENGKTFRDVCMKIVECMRCDFAWDSLDPLEPDELKKEQ